MVFLLLCYSLKTTIKFKQNDTLNGIIRHIQNTTKQQFLNETNIVTPTASSSLSSLYTPGNIFFDNSTGESNYWSSKNEGCKSWFQLDFHQNAVFIEDYIIHAFARDILKEWETYCSLDYQHWSKISHMIVSERPAFQDKGSYPVHVEEPMICKVLKLVQKDKRWGNADGTESDNYFIIHKIELFGIFYNATTLLRMLNTCKYKIPIIMPIFSYFILQHYSLFIRNSK